MAVNQTKEQLRLENEELKKINAGLRDRIKKLKSRQAEKSRRMVMGLLLPAILVLLTGFVIGPYYRQQCNPHKMGTELEGAVAPPAPKPNATAEPNMPMAEPKAKPNVPMAEPKAEPNVPTTEPKAKADIPTTDKAKADIPITEPKAKANVPVVEPEKAIRDTSSDERHGTFFDAAFGDGVMLQMVTGHASHPGGGQVAMVSGQVVGGVTSETGVVVVMTPTLQDGQQAAGDYEYDDEAGYLHDYGMPTFEIFDAEMSDISDSDSAAWKAFLHLPEPTPGVTYRLSATCSNCARPSAAARLNDVLLNPDNGDDEDPLRPVASWVGVRPAELEPAPGAEAERLEVHDDFLTAEESKLMIEFGEKLLADGHRSNKKQGSFKQNVLLTNPNTPAMRLASPAMKRLYRNISARVAYLTGIPEHEDDEVYWVSQAPHKSLMLPHHDLNKRPLRSATVFIYLSNQPRLSGNTQFPCFGGTHATRSTDPATGQVKALGVGDNDLCASLRRGFKQGFRNIQGAGFKGFSKVKWNNTAHSILEATCKDDPPGYASVQPKVGRAVTFRSRRPNGNAVTTTWHTACQVTERAEKKYTLNFFKEIRRGKFPPQLLKHAKRCAKPGQQTLCLAGPSSDTVVLSGLRPGHTHYRHMGTYRKLGMRQGFMTNAPGGKNIPGLLIPYYYNEVTQGCLYQSLGSGRWIVGRMGDMKYNSGWIRTLSKPLHKDDPSMPGITWTVNSGPKNTKMRWQPASITATTTTS